MNKRTKKVLIIISIILIFIFALSSLIPYLIPLPETKPNQTKEELMANEGRFITIDGRQMYYEDYDDEDAKETIIMLHGFGGSTYAFRRNAPYLADQGYRVILVDLLGYGLSDKDSETDYSHPAHAERISALMNELGIEQASFVGLSLGSSIITFFGHQYPERTKALILSGPLIDTKEFEPRLDIPRILSPLINYPPYQRVLQVIIRRYLLPGYIDQIFESEYHNDELVDPDNSQEYVDRIITGDWESSLIKSSLDTKNNVIDFPLTDIEPPVLIFVGANDEWVTRKQIENLHEQFGDARLEILPESGHLLVEEKSDEFNKATAEFLK